MMHLQKYTGIFLCSILLLTVTSCGGNSDKGGKNSRTGGIPDTQQPDEETGPVEPVNIGGDGDLYDSKRMINIDITMNPDDFNQLRKEGRSFSDALPHSSCNTEFEYTEFPATVTIDGDTMDKVNIRKKGFFGSLSEIRPSLKLDFDDLQKERTYQNHSRLTLNNNRFDTSNIKQCLAYDLFRQAGLPAPLCNFSTVTVNGENLGIYTNVEPIKKPFLKRAFNEKKGNLYEAQAADFGINLYEFFEIKTNEDENDRSDLADFANILQLPDDQFIAELPNYVDIDEFIQYWAMETLVGHWDSASGNANNFYLYHSEEDNLFHFIPWGTDDAFNHSDIFSPNNGPLYHSSYLTNRLFNIPEYRTLYENTLRGYLDNLWDETALTSYIDDIQALTNTTDQSAAALKHFIFGNGSLDDPNYQPSQRVTLERALAGEIPAGKSNLKTDTNSCEPYPTFDFTASASEIDGIGSGSFNFIHPFQNMMEVNASIDFVTQGPDPENAIVIALDENFSPFIKSIGLAGVDVSTLANAPDVTVYALAIVLEEPSFKAGTYPFHGLTNSVLLYEVDLATGNILSKPTAIGTEGSINIISTGPGPNDVEVQASGKLLFFPPSE